MKNSARSVYSVKSVIDEYSEKTIFLKAITEEQAITEARMVAKREGWNAYTIVWSRIYDSCKGVLEK